MDDELELVWSADRVKAFLNAKPLDPAADPLVQRILAQAQRLENWAGIKAVLVGITTRGTCAHGPSRVIAVNLEQLGRIFAGFSDEELDTAIFFALAHEFGHLLQSEHLTIETITDIKKQDKRLIEAHADILGGAWMGRLLYGGEPRLPEHLAKVGFALKSGSAIYPSAHQRAALMERGMANTIWVADAEARLAAWPWWSRLLAWFRSILTFGSKRSPTPIARALSKDDVVALVETAKLVLGETPTTPPPRPSASPLFRRVP